MDGRTEGLYTLRDLPQLSELLFGAKERYRTARATVRVSVAGALATRAHNRWVDHRRQRAAEGQERWFGDPLYEPRYLDFEDSERILEIWYEQPDRWRQETYSSDDSSTIYRVADGKGPWWVYKPPDRATVRPTNYAKGPPKFESVGLLAPWTLRWELGDKTLLQIANRRNSCAGRETVEVEARTVSLDYPPSGPLFREGADDHLLSVDAQIGVIMRLAARFGGDEFNVVEVKEIIFDQALPEGTFRLDLPGVEFRRVDG